MEKNRIGVPIGKYRCPKCHYLNIGPFLESKKQVRCYHCRTRWEVC